MKKDFFIVGIGASAGGLDALQSFFKNAKKNDKLAFVVIQHLSPDYKSLMDELLSKYTDMKVEQITSGVMIEPNNVYLIPPKKNVTIKDKKLFLEDSIPHSLGLNLPINLFFESLAKEEKEKAIAIVMSGTGSDGTAGIKAIKEEEGMVIVQDPEQAKFDGMPFNAISTGIVDYVLKTEEMPEVISNYIKHPYINNSDIENEVLISKEDIISKIIEIIFRTTDLDLSYYKRKTILRRIEKRMSINHKNDFESYLNYLKTNQEEVINLYKDLLIGVTKFFRDQDAFEEIKNKVIPQIVNQKDFDTIRVWITACSTGEEAYSIAILFMEYLESKKIKKDLKIFATDIDKRAIERAGKGIYDDSIARDVSKELVEKYFIKVENGYQIKKEVREKIIFAEHNILKDPPFHRIDFLSCRNLLIYFQNILQKKILTVLRFSLNDNDFMFLGKSETLGELKDLFNVYDHKYKIFRPKKTNRGNFANSYDIIFSNNNLVNNKNIIKSNEIPVKLKTETKKEIDSLNKILLKRYIPTCMICDYSENILSVYGDMNEYMKPLSGEIEFTISKMFDESLSIVILTGFHKVIKEKKHIIYKNIKHIKKDKNVIIDIKISPLKYDDKFDKYLEILFIEKSDKEISEEEMMEFNKIDEQNYKINDLEEELKFTKESLQSVFEELETSNEELQATNEELLASNEELQSTNEELQSVNEELITVNSEYQQKIEELALLNDDINNLIQNTKLGIIFLDENLCVRKFTPEVTQNINLIETDVGRPIFHLSNNLDYHEMEEDIKKVFKEGVELEKEVKNNKDEYLLIRIIPFNTNKKETKGLIITFVNITELKKINFKLEKSRKIAKNIINNSPIGVCITDKNGYFEEVNDAYCKLYGYEREELIGKHFTVVVLEEYKEFMKTLHDDFIAQKKELEGEWEVKRKDGQIMNILANATYIIGEDNEPKKATFIVNITAQKELEKKLKQAKEFAEKNSAYKSLFLANMSHEIRTPLNGIIGFLDLLKYTTLDEEQKEYMKIIEYSSKNLLKIITDILDISKIESNKLMLNEEFFDLNNLANRCYELLKENANKKNLEFYKCINLSGEYYILGDKIRVEQIIVNLLTNALKFTEKGKVEMKIEDREINSKQVEVKISVCDTGIGIPNEKIEEIFETFVQGDISSIKKYQGTGLGLAIVKKLIEMMNGKINVKSEVGKGTIFTVSIVFEKIKKEESEKSAKILEVSQENIEISKDIPVIIAEDNETNLKMLEIVLKKRGYKVESAKDGKEFLEKLDKNKYKLAFVDVQMPEINGIDVTEKIREKEKNSQKHLIIIGVTAYAMNGDREKCIEAGMDEYLSKPIKLTELDKILSKYRD